MAPSGVGKVKKSPRRPGASKVHFHDEVKFKTIKARGKGLPLSIMQLLDNAPDDDDEDSFEDDDDSSEIESEDEYDDDQRGSTQGHPVENSDAMSSGDGEGSQSDDNESPEGKVTFNDGHDTITRLQDDLFADDDKPDDGMFYLQSPLLVVLILGFQVCLLMRSAFLPSNNKSQPSRLKMLPRKTGPYWERRRLEFVLIILFWRKISNSNVS